MNISASSISLVSGQTSREKVFEVPISKSEVESATSELTNLVERFCGGQVSKTLLDSTSSTLTS